VAFRFLAIGNVRDAPPWSPGLSRRGDRGHHRDHGSRPLGGMRGTTVGIALVLCASPLSGAPVASAADPPTTNTSYRIGVLELDYFPVTRDGQSIDIRVTGDVGGSLRSIRTKVASMTAAVRRDLSLGTRYLGFENPKAPPALAYRIVDRKEYRVAVPSVPSSLNPDYPYRADYPEMFRKVDICDYVLHRGVQEVWIWAYQGPHQLDISESKMSSPYGDISNSYRLDDLPSCGRTYTVYTFNYGRGHALAVHSYAHQLEAELSFVDDNLFSRLFEGSDRWGDLALPGRCGSVHYPPNARADYEYDNPAPNLSDCNDWQPDGMGTTSKISCASWSCVDRGEDDDPQLHYLIWWMQHMPGRGNRVSYRGVPLRNWWDVHGDFDALMQRRPRLTLPAEKPDPAGSSPAERMTDSGNDHAGEATAATVPTVMTTEAGNHKPVEATAATVTTVVSGLAVVAIALLLGSLLLRPRRRR